MNLFAKIAQFERLCLRLSKQAQSADWKIDPETGKMVDKKPAGVGIPAASLTGPSAVSRTPVAKPSPLQPGAHPDLEHAVKEEKVVPKPVAPKAPSKTPTKPANWLTQYMGKEQEPASSVQPAIERANKPQTFDADRAAKEQIEKARNPFGNK